MKLKMHSFDFSENTLTFSIPAAIMESHAWGNVPDGVDVDLSKVTNDAALGINGTTDSAGATDNIARDEILRCITYIDNYLSAGNIESARKWCNEVRAILSPVA